jgi:uncharacterized Zn finger protein
MTSQKLTEAIIRAGATGKSFQRGLELYHGGAVERATIQGHTLSGECLGTHSPYYRVQAEIDSGGVRSAACTCPYDWGSYCKHVVALLLTYLHEPGQFLARKEPADLLRDLDRERLLALLVKLLEKQPELYEWLEAELAAPATSDKGRKKVAERKKVDAEVYRRRVRSVMHSLDHMRASEAYWHVGGLTDELRGVEKTALEFLDAGDAETARAILKALVEESHDGFDYVDDSNGELGDFLSGLGETMAEVILSLDLDEEKREDLIDDLEDIHEKLSDYGVEGLSVAIVAARYGWGEVPHEKQARPTGEDEEEKIEWDEEWDDEQAYGRIESTGNLNRTLTKVKLNVLERQGRTDDYLALCLKSGAHLRYALKLCELDRAAEAVSYALKNLAVAEEALALAKHLRESGYLDEAIRIGEQGLKLNGHKAALGEWLAPIEEAQGRARQALQSWLAAFHESPSLALYQTVKRLAGSKWSKLKPDVMSTLEKSWNKQPLVDVLLFEKMWDAAIKVADQKGAYHNVIATVADAVIPHRPEWVIRVSIKQAEKLIAETQSKYYPAAADWLRKARDAYVRLDQANQWQEYLQRLKEQYRRRPALQAQLARL